MKKRRRNVLVSLLIVYSLLYVTAPVSYACPEIEISADDPDIFPLKTLLPGMSCEQNISEAGFSVYPILRNNKGLAQTGTELFHYAKDDTSPAFTPAKQTAGTLPRTQGFKPDKGFLLSLSGLSPPSV